MKLGDFVRDYRVAHDLSQRQFALICGVSNGTISNLENGINPNTGKPITPTMDLIKKLATAMSMTMTDLMTVVDDMPVFIAGEQDDIALADDAANVTDSVSAITGDNPIIVTGRAGTGKSDVMRNFVRMQAEERPRSERLKQVFISFAHQNPNPESKKIIDEILKDIKKDPGTNMVYMVGQDGSYRERRLSNMQFAALNAILDQMPDTTEDK